MQFLGKLEHDFRFGRFLTLDLDAILGESEHDFRFGRFRFLLWDFPYAICSMFIFSIDDRRGCAMLAIRFQFLLVTMDREINLSLIWHELQVRLCFTSRPQLRYGAIGLDLISYILYANVVVFSLQLPLPWLLQCLFGPVIGGFHS